MQLRVCFVCVIDHWMDPHCPGQSHHTVVWKGKLSGLLCSDGFSYHESKVETCLLSNTTWVFFVSNRRVSPSHFQMGFSGRDRDQPWPHSYVPSPHHDQHEPVQRQPVPPLLQQPQRSGGGEANSWRKHQCQDPEVSTTLGFSQGISAGCWKWIVNPDYVSQFFWPIPRSVGFTGAPLCWLLEIILQPWRPWSTATLNSTPPRPHCSR